MDAPRRAILLVEDDSDLREVLAEVLTDDGRAVIQAVNGGEALAKFGELDGRCLVLLDVMLPDADGVEMLERLRQQPHGRQLAVVLMSGHPDFSAAAKYPSVVGTLQKPFDIEQLFALVDGHC